MNLFAAAGLEFPSAGRSPARAKRGASPSIRSPLFSPLVVEDAWTNAAPPDPALIKAAKDYARRVRGLKSEKETTFRPIFIDRILVEILGYTRVDPDKPYTLADEHGLGRGSVDTALGHFDKQTGRLDVVAPFELKGPDTRDLDAIMPGRGKTPVDQAWEYATHAPGAAWVLVSNCTEIRLYGYGRGRAAYELFDLTKLDDENELRRLLLILRADNLLEGRTASLLGSSDSAYRKITDDLYKNYSGLRGRLIQFLTDSVDGPNLALSHAIEPAQKILDRVLFIAFAQRRDLMRDGHLKRALENYNPYNPQPLWQNFLGLFRFVDGKPQADPELDIPPYNGGLFARDPIVDVLILPDWLAKDVAGLGEWDYRREVPVTVLGHIFEQSITDLEALRAQARGEPAPQTSQRKREGVVYTPDTITRFLVDRTLGRTLDERQAAMRVAHGIRDDAEVALEAEIAYLKAWLDDLRTITVVDPACGSGAFLVAAFDRLEQAYRAVLGRLDAIGAPDNVDPFDEIVTKNLFGVDINAESVEITKLSLWLKTARRGRPLQSLSDNVREGDSIVFDKSVAPKAFDWASFGPSGKFDVVIGNPPYVRMELLKPIKPWLADNYVVAADRADLYAYFFERGVKLLADGGRLGFISSSTFFRTGSGENLRTFLGDGLAMETIVDFGDLQVFEGVTTYPAILALQKSRSEGGDLSWLKVEGAMPTDLGVAFAQAKTMPRARLGAGSWRLEDDALARLRDKIAGGRKTLGEVYGPPLYGIKTGLNEAFVIDRATQGRLVQRDPKSAELLKPFLRGEDIKRWRVESEDLFLINTPKGKVDIEHYPAVRDWLLPFRKKLEARATQQEWWELQQAQLVYQESFSSTKLVYQDITVTNPFAFDTAGHFLANTCYFIPYNGAYLLGFLNSRVAWFQLCALTNIARGGYLRLRTEFVEQIRLPHWAKMKSELEKNALNATSAANHRLTVQTDVRDRLREVAPPGRKKTDAKT